MTMTQEEIDALISGGLDTTEEPKAESNSNGGNDEPEQQIKFDSLDPKLELLLDLQLPVSIELGRTNMLIRDILRLGRGSVIEFDKLVSEPIDVLINGKKVAEGEVVVIDKHFGIRITTLIDPSERLKAARS
jgi:flagellar motor switch protein FliN/FliY